ncbi:MAG: YihY/virulence factor BrkB family protein, partial [Alphaproteobacteria bacterium]
VLKGFGVHDKMRPFLLNLMAPLGDKAEEVVGRIIQMVENVNAGVLGTVGLAILFYTVISLLHKVERSVNYVWRVESSRGVAQRFRDYLSVLLVGPVLVFSSLGITATLSSSTAVTWLARFPLAGAFLDTTGRLLPLLLLTMAFSFIYVFLPNTKVRVGPALIGGLLAGVLWHLVGWGFAEFLAGSARYTAVYSTFATLILFMLWLYLTWLILLLGSAVAFYLQHPEQVREGGWHRLLSLRAREALGIHVAREVARCFINGSAPPTTEGLAGRSRAPHGEVEAIVSGLQDAGLVTQTTGEPAGLVPALPPDRVPLRRLVASVREVPAAAGQTPPPPDWLREGGVGRLMEDLDQAAAMRLSGRTWQDLAIADGEAEPHDRAAHHKGETA